MEEQYFKNKLLNDFYNFKVKEILEKGKLEIGEEDMCLKDILKFQELLIKLKAGHISIPINKKISFDFINGELFFVHTDNYILEIVVRPDSNKALKVKTYYYYLMLIAAINDQKLY